MRDHGKESKVIVAGTYFLSTVIHLAGREPPGKEPSTATRSSTACCPEGHLDMLFDSRVIC